MWYAALIMGVVGSLHCAAMCGPLMFALGANNSSFFKLIVHHAGRWVGYIILALLFRIIVSPLEIFHLQQYVALASGVLLLLFGLKNYIKPVRLFFEKISQSLSSQMAKVSSRPTGVILFGILNGLLPCGLSFGAAILSVNEANVAASAMFMVYFGLGTLPMLLVLSYVPKWMNKSSLTKLRSFSPKLMIVIGFLLVIRSMNLGIPYVSPTYNPASEKMECCSEE